MRIEKIKKQGEKYKVILDNGLSIKTYDDVIIKDGLLFDRDISIDLLEKITQDTNYSASYHSVLNLINRRLRSEYEIRNYLNKKGIKSDDIESIIDNLKRINLINDENFAKAYFNDKINLSLDGPEKIKRHLKENRIDEEIIENVVCFSSDLTDERIKKIIDKKLSLNTKSEYIFKNKMMNYLVNLGYYKSDIIRNLNGIHIDIDYSKEMDREYNKLKDKFSGKELIYKLKGKLYSKGYKMDDINRYIDSVDI